MSLKSDIEEFFSKGNHWPGDIEVDVPNVTLVEDEIVDTRRWSILHTAVYRRDTLRPGTDPVEFDTEYVAVDYHEPATEMQEWGDQPAEVYDVEPEVVQVTITKFHKKQ